MFKVNMFEKKSSLHVITGPCVIENEKHTMLCAESLVRMFENLPLKLIFKASYDKANRTSHESFRGPGIKEGLKILEKVKKTFDIPLTTDIHHPEEAAPVAEIADVLQIPAFLCRQTDLLLAAAKTNVWVNVKKGQFLSPWDMSHIVEKLRSAGGTKILLTERGTTFGYQNLVSDMRSILIMKDLGVPVCFDASHSVQLPGAAGSVSGGDRKFIPGLTKAAISLGIQALFIESHPDPQGALSDANTVYSLEDLATLLQEIIPLHALCSS